MKLTYFPPADPRPPAHLSDREYGARHCQQTRPGTVVDLTLDELEAACRAAAVIGRKGDAGYLTACECTTTRKEGGPAFLALIDQDEGGGEPDWQSLDEYEGFAWTTASHRPDKPSWRVVIPLIEPIAHGKIRSPFKGAFIRNRTQPAFLPTHCTDVGLVEWRRLRGTKHLDAIALGATEQAFEARDRSLLGAAFEAAGMVLRAQAGGLVVRCPWVHLHSDGEPGGTAVFHADPDNRGFGKFHCSRTECAKANRDSGEALNAIRNIPAVAEELRHWPDPGLNGYLRVDAPPEDAVAEATSDATEPRQDTSGLQLAPGGWPWVLRQGQWCWLHAVDKQTYTGPIVKTDIRLQIRRSHGRVVALNGPRGGDISEADFEKIYIQRIGTLKSTYTARATTWDGPTQTLTLAALTWADVPAVRHLDVEEWLRVMAGEAYPRLAQWLASCFALDRPAPALYLHGAANVGKSLLANGIAKLWNTTPAPFKEALSDFNEAAGSCPLMYADEGFPEGMSFNDFREMVTSPSRRVNEKYKAKYAVHGCVRILLSTNNSQALRYQRTGALTANDLAAISNRLLVINANGRAADVLKRFVAQSFADSKIAQFAAWLRDTVELEPSYERMCARPSGSLELLDALQGARYVRILRVIAPAFPSQPGVAPVAVKGVVMPGQGCETCAINVRELFNNVSRLAFGSLADQLREQDVRDFVNAFRTGEPFRVGQAWHHPVDVGRITRLAESLD